MRFGVLERECEAAYSNVWGGKEAFRGHACPSKLIKVCHVVGGEYVDSRMRYA